MKVFFDEKKQKKPILSWCENPEDKAIKQAVNLSNLPFLFKHVALMPDCHAGYGMPIGGVIACDGVIIPNCVGVDIGCFSGDTKIPLLNGEQKSLKELSDKKESIYVYSLNDKLNIVPGKAIPKLTRINSNLVEVVISGGERIKCTPDHQFMLLDGTYKIACELNKFDSLMPLYRAYQSRDGYERIKTKIGTGILTHVMVARYFLGEKKNTDVIHHKDGSWFNNAPENIEYKDAKLHNKEHRKDNPIFGTEEFKKKRLLTLKEKGFYGKEFKEKKQKVAIENIKEYNKTDKKKNKDKLAGARGKEYLIKYNKSEKGRKRSSENGKLYGFGKTQNHKVLYVRKLNKKEDVYCLTVDKYHNFALSAGVFVHNCGMRAMKTNLVGLDQDCLKGIMSKIREKIPLGFNHHKEKQEWDRFIYAPLNISIIEKEINAARHQLGTLGGGNHFIEIQKGSDGFIWFMIHSGSRNFGLKIAKEFNEKAQNLCKKWYSNIPEYSGEDGLAFLPVDSNEGEDYIEAMSFAVEFAEANRSIMMNKIVESIEESLKFNDLIIHDMFDVAHNYASLENHYTRNVWVHRKGATLAREGIIGIIPGSQGTASYIVEGLGNPKSFNSCSHGAGRKLGRNQAIKTLNLEEEIKRLDDQGIVHSIRNVEDLDEAAGAYKRIDTVMKEQEDLVKIKVELKPLAVIKA